MPTLLDVLVVVAAVASTYLFCIRPMLRGRGRCCSFGGQATPDPQFDDQVAALLAELRAHRDEEVPDTARAHPHRCAAPPSAGE